MESTRAIAEEDVVARRRTWFWRSVYRKALFVAVFLAAVGAIMAIAGHHSWWGGVTPIFHVLGMIGGLLPNLAFIVVFYGLINVLILFGPLLMANLRQIRGYEPGDANWGVKIDDVRGQAEAKEEITRVVTLWQSGEEFEKAGGKRERGLLFLGAPGTGKTMIAKAIATNFNCPFVTIPGSGFAGTFIGMDVIVVSSWPARPGSSRASGAASASCSSTRSTPSGCGGQRSAAAPAAHGPPATRSIQNSRTTASSARGAR